MYFKDDYHNLMDEVINLIRNVDLYDINELGKECEDFFFNELLKKNIEKMSVKCPCSSSNQYCELFKTLNMGYGVRSKKYIPFGTKIGCYLGTIKNMNDREIIDDWRYDFQYIFNKYYVDGSNKLSLMSSVNHSIDNNIHILYELHYTEELKEECHIVFQASKDIEMNEELFINYGDDYWNHFNKQNKNQKLITDYFTPVN